MLAGIVLLAISSAAQGGVELVKDGRAVSEIVIAPDAIQAVKLAAEDLQKHLKQMSGAELPIVTASSPGVASGGMWAKAGLRGNSGSSRPASAPAGWTRWSPSPIAPISPS